MATHSSVFAWRILGTGEPVGLLSMGSHRVGHDCRNLAAAAAAAVELVWDFYPPGGQKKKFLLFQVIKFVAICYCSLRKLNILVYQNMV